MGFKGKTGISIELITQKMRAETRPKRHKTTEKSTLKPGKGKLKADDWKNISMGVEILKRVLNDNIRTQDIKVHLGTEDVSKFRKDFVQYSSVMQDCLFRLDRGVRENWRLESDIEVLSENSRIAQAARDGIILKQEKRQEKVDGQTKEVTYDTAMTPKEVTEILRSYRNQLEKNQCCKLENYYGLGLGLAGIVGMMFNNSDEANKGTGTLVTMGTMAIGGVRLIQSMLESDGRKRAWQTRNRALRMRDDLWGNEQVSSKAEEDYVRNIENMFKQESKINKQELNKEFAFNVLTNIAAAMISGAYINKTVKTNENGKIDGKTLAAALAALQVSKGISRNFINFARGVQETKKDEIEIQELGLKVQNIISQMEEKVYCLNGAEQSFDSLEINNLKGKFYPKKNYETDEITYATTIDIPEFSMKRGDVVLLSGESGAGKSTFLRLLKRGDANNRNCIKLDNGQKVDNLGNEYISFRPSIELGNETNVLYQLTGKESVSDLDENEVKKLTGILRELKLDFPDLLEQLASRKFMEFSTGQQRRLALSKLFYRIDDGTSVIIVDEPVGNVEDSLIREQLEMIKNYAESRNVMLLLTTHRLNLAQDLVTKRYHIDSDGVLKQIPIEKKKEVDNER
ncbi:MAG: ATP-binding cassette domain-containing protein [Clostridia bacterium]|nr:ATP-binding cassette domain-containing protein [Clostridia bacterium]